MKSLFLSSESTRGDENVHVATPGIVVPLELDRIPVGSTGRRRGVDLLGVLPRLRDWADFLGVRFLALTFDRDRSAFLSFFIQLLSFPIKGSTAKLGFGTWSIGYQSMFCTSFRATGSNGKSSGTPATM